MTNEKNSPSMEAGKIDKTAPESQLSNYNLEDGFYVLKKNSRAGLLIQAAREGKPKRVKKLLEAYPSKEAIEEAMDAALKNNNWEMAQLISDFCHDADFETYSECLKKQFLKAIHNEDIEKVKFFLQKLIENIVGEFTDETGRSTLEIALESNPADLILILSNYGFSEQSLNYAYKCMSNK